MIQKNWILLAILTLSAGLHLWNPVGFPDIFFDEGVYMSRAVNFLETGNPQETYLYDHPYLGQIILGGVLHFSGFPYSLGDTTNPDSLEGLYLIPRIFMGLLVVLDTFLVYKIAEKNYEKKTAIISSILFAVMPFSWILNRILLDSLLLPLLLGSILVALHVKDSQRTHSLLLISGTLMGLAIFTKIPAFVFLVLIGFIVLRFRRKIFDMVIWILPVLLIPLIWPINAISLGQFDLWSRDVLWQVGRESGGLSIAKFFFEADPVLFLIGLGGVAFAAYRKDFFVLTWFIPMTVFLGTVGFTQYFHWIPMIPIFCIAGSIMIVKVIQKIKIKNSEQLLKYSIIIIVIFGVSSNIPLISTDLSKSQFQAMSFVLEKVDKESNVTILASPVYSWAFDKVFERKYVMYDYSMILFFNPPTKNILLVSDNHFILDIPRGPQLKKVYENTNTIAKFDNNILEYDTQIYPYGSFKLNQEGFNIDIRVSNGTQLAS